MKLCLVCLPNQIFIKCLVTIYRSFSILNFIPSFTPKFKSTINSVGGQRVACECVTAKFLFISFLTIYYLCPDAPLQNEFKLFVFFRKHLKIAWGLKGFVDT